MSPRPDRIIQPEVHYNPTFATTQHRKQSKGFILPEFVLVLKCPVTRVRYEAGDVTTDTWLTTPRREMERFAY